ncbi:MAG: hypothetical protein HZB26_07400 [Candidatus Hydrogenedentes bacterium]|nr:hypothetical protein [Candidatus Hydrogenedentota bacterium]
MLRRIGIVAAAFVTALTAIAAAEGYRTSVSLGSDSIPVVVVKGTPYEMGYGFGSLMKDDVVALLGSYLKLAQSQGEPRYTDASLDKAWDSVSPFIHPRFIEELHGVADGSHMPFDTVRRAHMIPVVSDYACSGFALWGSATKDGHLYQIRNLDYEVHAGLQDHPCIVVYSPAEGIPHVNVTFAGSIGVNTGMNAEGVTLTEIGDTPGKAYPFDLNGVHFTTLFRDILYEANNLDEAVDMIEKAQRIKMYHYIIGDGKNKKAVKMRAFAPGLEIWHDADPDDEAAPNVLKDVVYHAEGRNPIAYAHLTANLGKYDAERMISLSQAVPIKGGNLLDVVYDATALELWASYASGEQNAYLRPYIHLKLSDYLPYDGQPKAGAVTAVAEAPKSVGAQKATAALLLLVPLGAVAAGAFWLFNRR